MPFWQPSCRAMSWQISSPIDAICQTAAHIIPQFVSGFIKTKMVDQFHGFFSNSNRSQPAPTSTPTVKWFQIEWSEPVNKATMCAPMAARLEALFALGTTIASPTTSITMPIAAIWSAFVQCAALERPRKRRRWTCETTTTSRWDFPFSVIPHSFSGMSQRWILHGQTMHSQLGLQCGGQWARSPGLFHTGKFAYPN